MTKKNAMSLFAKEPHKKAARMLGYALTLGGHDVWHGCALIFRARLTPQERAALAWAGLRSLDHEDAEKVAHAILGEPDAPVRPWPLFDYDDAAFWADTAGPDELAAYAEAALTRMAPAARDTLLHRMRRAA